MRLTGAKTSAGEGEQSRDRRRSFCLVPRRSTAGKAQRVKDLQITLSDDLIQIIDGRGSQKKPNAIAIQIDKDPGGLTGREKRITGLFVAAGIALAGAFLALLIARKD